jgi:signal peptidase I
MKKAKLLAESQSLLWTILLILFIRGFVAEPFKIPSESMVPTLLIGDHLFVAKASYDFGIPFTNIKLIHIADPKRGDVVVFKYPNYEGDAEKNGQFYIKRVIGLPGDEITVTGGVPSINGVPVQQEFISDPLASHGRLLPDFPLGYRKILFLESLPGRRFMDTAHWVQRDQEGLAQLPGAIEDLQAISGKKCLEMGKYFDLTVLRPGSPVIYSEICPFKVPEGKYFVMGDNREHSADGRHWGFVDRSLLKGRALFIWFSLLGSEAPYLRWRRLGLTIN